MKLASSISELKDLLSLGPIPKKLGQRFQPADGFRRDVANTAAGTFTNLEKRLDACGDHSTGKSVWQHGLGLKKLQRARRPRMIPTKKFL
jgi:hypothetical protein